MRCHQVRKRLNAFVDAELPDTLREALASHLQVCPACRQAAARARQLAELLKVDAPPAVPEGFTARVLAQARRQGGNPQPTLRPVSAFVRWWTSVPKGQRVAVAAVVLLGLTAGLLMGRQTGQSANLRPQTRTAAPEDPVAVFNLDYLGSTPDGSLPQAYLTLVSAPHGSGE